MDDLINRQAAVAQPKNTCENTCEIARTANDCISRQAAIDAAIEAADEWDGGYSITRANMIADAINNIAPSAQPEPQWIPIKWRDCTDEDREKYGFSNDIVAVFDCEMPDDDQPILVTTSHGYVNQDVCYIDDGYSLDSGWDWIDDIKAWMPLPEGYRGDERENNR
jgi:hypothetical protein